MHRGHPSPSPLLVQLKRRGGMGQEGRGLRQEESEGTPPSVPPAGNILGTIPLIPP